MLQATHEYVNMKHVWMYHENMYRSFKPKIYFVWPFHLVTLDYQDLYYGHKAQEMILTKIHCLCLRVTSKFYSPMSPSPEKSKILTLTWPVTSSVTSSSNFWPCTGSSRTGLSNGVWNLEIGTVVWEISGGGLCPLPQQHVLLTRPQRGEG